MLAHNTKMKQWLSEHGIEATPKRIDHGSLGGTWRIYNRSQKWTEELMEKFNALGFTYWGKPLGRFEGNGGIFHIFTVPPKEARF